MKRRLVGQQVLFRYSVGEDKQGERWWMMDSYYHRNDNGPAWESMRTGYCQWWEHGELVRGGR